VGQFLKKSFFESYLQQYPNGVFANLAKLKIAAIEESAATSTEPGRPSAPDNSAEIAYWDSIKDQAEKGYFEAYLKQYPDGTFASVAKLRIASSEKAKPEPVEVARLEPTPAESVRSVEPEELARAMQTELSRLGCLSGRVDGKWGSGSQKALKDFAGRQGIKLASGRGAFVYSGDSSLYGSDKAV
jgi:Putative peptidoglycan binding domain